MVLIQAFVVLLFVLIHLFIGKLPHLSRVPRSSWLSVAGGVSVAYVFIHVFPELAAAQNSIAEEGRVLPWIGHHAYFVALGGLTAFYGVEKVVKSSQKEQRTRPDSGRAETTTHLSVFWLHVASFSIYNGLIGYLLVHREDETLQTLLLFAFAMTLHFTINDYRLRMDHRLAYKKMGRWFLVAAIVLGWLLGLTTAASDALVGMLFAFLAGGIILNVLKEELPEERQSRFIPFCLGAGGFGIFLLFL